MSDAHFTINIFIALLLVASSVAMAAKWVKVPYTLMLVIVGLVISPMHFLPVIHISPELILLIFLPALLFEAAWNLKLDHLRENLVPILLLALPGVVLSVGIIGVLLHVGIGMAWVPALLFGSMISATDPVSVLALFKKLNLPRRLNTIVEGESLLNDGMAVVVFRIISGLAAGSAASMSTLAFGSSREFAVVVFGGLAVGLIIGIIASTLTSYFDDHLLEITLTTIAAYGSYLVAEGMHVSGVIAILIAGLVIGNYGKEKGMSPSTQVAVNSFWEYAAFVVNSLVFLLIGLEIQLASLAANLGSIAWAVLAILVARGAVVYALMPAAALFSIRIPLAWMHVLTWGGLRGSLSIALVLSLPTALEDRAELVTMIFGTVIFSLLVQGLTVSPLLGWLRLTQKTPAIREYELLHGRLLAETSALAELDALRHRGLLTESVYRDERPIVHHRKQELTQGIEKLQFTEVNLAVQQRLQLRRHLINVRKARLGALVQEGMLSESAYRTLKEQLDEELSAMAEAKSHEATER